MSTLSLQPAFATPSRAAVRPAVRRPATGEVRLTRRGRLVFLALALMLVLAGGLALAAGSDATRDGSAPAPTQVVTVGAGDTLWELAADAAAAQGASDTRAMVSEIQELNGLESGALQLGQTLRVPLG